jgi:transcriptional regulator with XRE-family HTH domain
MYPPGLQLRQTREKLGLTYRDVEKSSLEIAVKRGRSEFILHISRLADIENRNVAPNLYKLYSLSVIYHLNVSEISSWYEAPFQQAFQDGASFPSPCTHLSEFLKPVPKTCIDANKIADLGGTGLLPTLPLGRAESPGFEDGARGRYRYGYIGLSDRRMTPLLRPGSMVLVDTLIKQIEETEWKSEYDRPMYFVELRESYRCGWFYKCRTQLIMQPHTLSHCPPESWRMPDEAELVGKVVGVVTYLNEPWTAGTATVRAERQHLSGKDS